MEVPGGSQQRGQDCLLQVPAALQPTPVHAAGATSQRSCSSQRPLTARAACPTAPACPQVHLARDFFFSRRLPGSVFLTLWTPWSFICSSYIIWD